MRSSPLSDALKRHGADLGEADGAEVALAFDGLDEEHRAVRKACGVIDLHPMGVGRLAGPDRSSFLHDVLTAAVQDREGHVFETAYMEASGDIVAYFRVAMLDDAALFLVEGGLDPLEEGMQTYVMISDVELERLDHAAIALQGPDTPEVLDTLDLPDPRAGRVATTGDLVVLGVEHTGSDGVWIVGPAGRLAERWDEAVEAGARPVGRHAEEALRIEAGTLRFGVDVTGEYLPQEVGIRHAVDFEKGCYPGQEAVAKLENLGQPRVHRETLVLEGDVPTRGAPVTADGTLIGEVTSAARSPGVGGIVAIGLLKRGEGEPGTEVEVDGATGRVLDGLAYQD